MNFRFGTIKDAEIVRDFLKDSWLMHADKEPEFVSREVITASDAKDYLADCFNGSGKSYLLISEIDGNLAGFAKVNIQDIQKFFNQTKVMYVDDIYTLEQYRGKGVAAFLFKEIEKLAKKKGIKWLKARVYSFNKPAQAAMQSSGFKNLYSEYFKILE